MFFNLFSRTKKPKIKKAPYVTAKKYFKNKTKGQLITTVMFYEQAFAILGKKYKFNVTDMLHRCHEELKGGKPA